MSEEPIFADRMLSLGLARVSEQAAIAAAKLVGRGDEKAADQAAVDAMRTQLNLLDIQGRVVIGEGLFWYRKRTFTVAKDDLVEEIAGFPHVNLDQARLFSCGISWAPQGRETGKRRALDSVELHDRGGRARFRTPDGRELELELHGRDWPLSSGRESLVLILNSGKFVEDPLASSWTSLDAARVGIDIGWLAVDCAPVISETGEQPG